jgi:uncharacterized protein with ParB-like and HNH nuclease domain/ribosomal protein L31E
MINTYDYTLEKLIVEKDYLFEVPNYQRSYVWTEKQIYQFLKDGSFCFSKFVDVKDKFEHYAGQMIFRSLKKKRDGKEQLEIIDGQQRLTTFMILVAAAVDLIKIRNSTSVIADELKHRYLLSAFEGPDEEFKKKLRLSKRDLLFWNKLTDGFFACKEEIKPELESQEKIWIAYRFIRKYLESITDGDSDKEKENKIKSYIEALSESFRVVVLMTDNPGHEFALFQIVNDRGLPLTPGEMLKARTIELFSNQRMEERKKRFVNRAEEIWEDILSDPGELTVEYLKWNYTAVLGRKPESVKQLTLNEQYERDIFECLNQREISMDLQDKMLEILEQLQDNVHMCRFLQMGTFPLKEASGNLNLLLGILIRGMKNTFCIPLYLKLLYAHKEKKALMIAEKLTPMLVKVYFMAKIMGTLNDESVMNCYMKIWERLDEPDFHIDEIKSYLETLLKKDKCKIEFFTKINQAIYARGAGNIKAKFLLLMIELQYLKENEMDSAEYGDDSVNINFDQISVEHILHEGVDEESVSRNFYEGIHKIGNLTLLGKKINSRVKNKAFVDKRELYCMSPYHITREVGKLKNWNYKDYTKRQEEMVKVLMRAFEL